MRPSRVARVVVVGCVLSLLLADAGCALIGGLGEYTDCELCGDASPLLPIDGGGGGTDTNTNTSETTPPPSPSEDDADAADTAVLDGSPDADAGIDAGDGGCAAGFQDKDLNGTCLPACTVSTCQAGIPCVDEFGAAACVCRTGLTGNNCTTACPANLGGANCDYRLVYRLSLPLTSIWKIPTDIPYSTNNAGTQPAFKRVGYRLILDTNEVWVEMDTFTTDATKLGIPVDWIFQQSVSGVLVFSFAANQTNILSPPAGGNVELFSNCYTQTGGDSTKFDYSDTVSGPDCYGSFQLHVKQLPVISYNRWSAGGVSDIGIGVNPSLDAGTYPDWTFQQNINQFTTRTLEVYAR